MTTPSGVGVAVKSRDAVVLVLGRLIDDGDDTAPAVA
jgi:hypothetical protein